MLDQPVRFLQGVGPARAGMLDRLGIRSVEDLLLHVPRDYLDWSTITPVPALEPGTSATVVGEIVHSETIRTRKRGKRILQAVLDDGRGSIVMTFFNPGHLVKRLRPGIRVAATGTVDTYAGRKTLSHPRLGFLDDGAYGAYHDGGLIPVYPSTAGLSQAVLRRAVQVALEASSGAIPEVLPLDVLGHRGFGSREEVIRSVHVPPSRGTADTARGVLALEELVLFQLLLQSVRLAATGEKGVTSAVAPEDLRTGFLELLPFRPTCAQRRSLEEILADMGSAAPMRRLLQGDVGCGKTVVAAAACWVCARSGHQAAVLAPTEVLARQHYRTFSALLPDAGVPCEVLTGGTAKSDRDRVLGMLQEGHPMVLIGTHALLEGDVTPSRLGLAVVDEQHRFGVRQRESLLSGISPRPDMLIMTATPIPRTLAMTFYGDLDISTIDELPSGRGAVETSIVPPREDRSALLEFIASRVELGEKAYVVYPLIESTEREDLRDATSGWEILRSGALGQHGVGLLHGSMSSDEKERAAREFREGRVRTLVCTSVVEVGLDVPEATVMVVANAERFGLSQLHQLRGRIGRSERQGWCFLLPGENAGDMGLRRLEAISETRDGFEIARKDLELRGPGEVFGVRQHGLPSFRVADLSRDSGLVAEALELCRKTLGNTEPSVLETARRRFSSASNPPV